MDTNHISHNSKNCNNTQEETGKIKHNLEQNYLEYQSIFDFMPDGGAIHEVIRDDSGDIVDCKFIMVNNAFEKHTGVPREKFIGKLASEISPMTQDKIDMFCQVVNNNKNLRFIDSSIIPNKYFDVSAFSLGEAKFATIFRDITEKIQLEAEFKDSEGKYQTLINNLPQKIFFKDCNSTYISCNASYARDLKIDVNNIMGKTDYDFFPPHLAEKYINDDKIIIKSGISQEMIESYILRGKKFTIKTVKTPVSDSTGKAIGIIGIFWDITEENESAIALKKSEERYRRLIDNAPEAICIIDTKDNARYIDGNANLEKLLGLPLNEILKSNFRKFSPEKQSNGRLSEELWFEYLKKALSGDQIIFEWDTLNYKDKSIVPCEVRLVKLDESNDNLLRGSIIDISERKNIDDKLRFSEKLQAVGQLAGGIAHDFNNQLGGIMGYADLLYQKLEDNTLKTYASGILTCAESAAKLTQQLLTFSRKGKYFSVELDIHKVISEVASLLYHSINKNIKIIKTLTATESTVTGDPTLIQNALLNIALNARDSMPRGGTLTFATELTSLSEEYCNSHANGISAGDYLQISISDTGSGMSKNVCEHIFEPFFTTKELGKGTGMGLASVYGTIKSHGGTINVYSEVGRGTVFRIFLPAIYSSPAQPCNKKPRPYIVKNATILLVDDEITMRRIATEMLLDVGYKVHTCENGIEAIGYFESEWKDIDAVILDMIMPNISGRDTFKALKKIDPNVKVLISSGYTINGEAQEVLDDGAIDFVGKPFRQHELLEKIAAILA